MLPLAKSRLWGAGTGSCPKEHSGGTVECEGILKVARGPARGKVPLPVGNLAYDHVVDRLYLVYVDRPTTSSSDTNIFFRYSFTTRTPGRYRKVLGPLADRFTMASHLLDWN